MFLDYDLPPELIAQEPLAERDRARLLVLRRADGSLAHHVFRDLPDLLAPGDLLVRNDTRVLHARLRGRRAGTAAASESRRALSPARPGAEHSTGTRRCRRGSPGARPPSACPL